MIKIIKNPNFPQFLEVFLNSELVEEVQGRAKALRLARKVAKEENISCFVAWNGKLMQVEE